MDLIVLIVLVILLAAAFGPRAGWYGTSSTLWDVLSALILVVLVVWVLRLLGVLVF